MMGARAMYACLVNCSYPRYNLGLAKYCDYLEERGWRVKMSAEAPQPLFAHSYDLVAFSAIFSWNVLELIKGVWQIQERAGKVEIGGPGTFALARYIERETGIEPVRGLDPRFERQMPLENGRGRYLQTVTSRGCPTGCSFCIVPQLEGKQVVTYYRYPLAPVVLDNNILATPVSHQELLIERLLGAGYRYGEIDFNSGFEPARFDYAAFARFNRLPLESWRLAFDETGEAAEVERAMRLLRDNAVGRSRIRVYVLFGNEPPDACHERAQKVIEWGGEPFAQPMMALNVLEKRPLMRHGWSEQELVNAARYYNRWIWRKVAWRDYDRSYRSQGHRVTDPVGEDPRPVRDGR
jgi:pyruvate-formate lyase-activating enzyme